MMGLGVGEDFVILACIVLTQYLPTPDGRTLRQTDRRTDMPTIASTVRCNLACYADALQTLLPPVIISCRFNYIRI